VDPVVEHGFRPTIADPAMLHRWIARSPAPFHLEIDTGMARSGVRWDDDAALREAAAALASAAGWEGVFTHFHSADTDPASVATQWRRFEAVLSGLPRRPGLVHAANSAAALCGRAYAADLVRPGIFLYGGSAGPTAPSPVPVAALRARVLAVRSVPAGDSVSYGAAWRAPRRTTVATLGVGYADGLPRATPRSGEGVPRHIELRGRAVPLAGRVTMDMSMVAVDDGQVSVGDVATVFGGIVSLDDQARAAGTISYEMLTALGSRVPRHYR
jgi:alanine racemase